MKAHDVRRLTTCDGCGELGMRNPPLMSPVRTLILTPSGRCLHPSCISEGLLMKCVEAELVTIRVNDLDRPLFLRIVDELERRRAEEARGHGI